MGKEFQAHLFGNCSIGKASINTRTDSNGITLILFFSILCIVMGTIAAHFLKFTPPTFNNGKLGKGGFKKLYLNYFLILIVMGYCIFVSLINIEWRRLGTVPAGANLWFAIGIVIFYLFPFFLILRTKRRMGLSNKENQSGNKEIEETVQNIKPANSDIEDLVTELPNNRKPIVDPSTYLTECLVLSTFVNCYTVFRPSPPEKAARRPYLAQIWPDPELGGAG